MSEYKLGEENLEEQMTDMDKKESFLKKNKMIIIIIIIILLILISLLIILLLTHKKEEDNNDNNDSTKPIYINPKDNYTHCIIFLHGLDNKPENFVDLFTKDIILNKINNTKIILLRAPKMILTYNKERLTSWFDILSFPLDSKNTYNFEDIKKSSNTLRNIIEQESKILGDYQKIYIGGHSQGAIVSLYTGYNFEKLIGGVIVCSGFLVEQGEIVGNKNNLNVYLGHGDKDQAIPFEYHLETIKRIEKYDGVQKYYYEGHGHAIIAQEKKDIEDFLNKLII